MNHIKPFKIFESGLKRRYNNLPHTNEMGETNVEYITRLYETLEKKIERYDIKYHHLIFISSVFSDHYLQGNLIIEKYPKSPATFQYTNLNKINSYTLIIKIILKRSEENSSDILSEATEFLIDEGFTKSEKEMEPTELYFLTFAKTIEI